MDTTLIFKIKLVMPKTFYIFVCLFVISNIAVIDVFDSMEFSTEIKKIFGCYQSLKIITCPATNFHLTRALVRENFDPF